MRWNQRPKLWKVGVLLVVGIIAGIVSLSSRRSPSYPPVMIFDNMKTLPTPSASLFERYIPMTWGWLWRAKEAIVGQPAQVNIGASVFDAGKLMPPDLGTFASMEATFTNANGLRVWVAEEKDLNDLRKRLDQQKRILYAPRILTAHEVEATLEQTSPARVDGKPEAVGLKIDSLPRVYKNGIDLMTLIQSTEVITNGTVAPGEDVSLRTNIVFAGRFQMAAEKGVLVLSGDTSQPGACGVIILARLPKPKK